MSNRGTFRPSQEADSYAARTRSLVQDGKLLFGKHRGQTIEWLMKNDPGYLHWAKENVAGFSAHVPTPKSERVNQGSSRGGYPKPGRKKFVSKAVNPYVRSTDAPKGAFEANGFQTQERMDYHMSQLNPTHRVLEALEDHLDSVFMKHHGAQFTGEFEEDEPPW